MPLQIVTIPCRTDNYAFLIHSDETGETALVDAPEAAPVLERLESEGWKLSHVLITHHHGDHVEGLQGLKEVHSDLRVVGAEADRHRLPPLDMAVSGGDKFSFADETVEVIDVSGHTVGHVAFHIPGAKAAFTADSLMALGCGRVFEGTPEMMWDSLSRLAALPPETVIYSGHEYTRTNARFALTIEPENKALQARARDVEAAAEQKLPTVPSLLSEELETNPFLRSNLNSVKNAISMQGAADAEVFAEIRARKDRF